MKQHIQRHRNKFFVVFSVVMVVVFTWWIWPAKEGTAEAVNTGTKALSVP